MNIIVRAPNWIGDCVLATPFLKLLREKNPEAKISVLAKRPGLEIFTGNPYIDEALPYERFWSQAQALRHKKFDSGYLLPNSFSSALFFAAAGIKDIAGYDTQMRGIFINKTLDWRGNIEPRARRYIRILDPLMPAKLITPKTYPCEMVLDDAAVRQADELLQGINTDKLVAINPCSNAPSRRWRLERYAALTHRLAEDLKATVLILGGPNSEDQSAARQILEAAPSPSVHNLCGKTNLKTLSAVLKKVKAVVSNDSGIMHIAAAVKAPLLVLAGAGDMAVTGPWTTGPFQIFDKRVYCSPCVKNKCHNRSSPMLCMESITVDEVLAAVQKFLLE